MDPTKRFSHRVADYGRYRPRYPREILTYLETDCDLRETAVIVDVGSGTGLLSELFLAHGNRVIGVEPNDEMRAAAEATLADQPRFVSVNGRAEATTLPDDTADFVTAGQAFHWFDPEPTQREFRRILRPDGWVMLVWNTWDDSDSPMMHAYRALVEKHAIKYQETRHRRSHEEIPAFYGSDPAEVTFSNMQIFDFAGLKGRALSSSYAPLPDHPHHEPFIAGLRDLFDRYAEDGRIRFEYRTKMYVGRLA